MNKEALVSTLAIRERYRDDYWQKHDPIVEDRLLWRAQTFRHTVHLLPGQTILELGCGELRLTRALLSCLSRRKPDHGGYVSKLGLQVLPRSMQKSSSCSSPSFLDASRTAASIASLPWICWTAASHQNFSRSFTSYSPLEARWSSTKATHGIPCTSFADCCCDLSENAIREILLAARHLYELLSEIGFIRIYAVFNDFVFAPLTRSVDLVFA